MVPEEIDSFEAQTQFKSVTPLKRLFFALQHEVIERRYHFYGTAVIDIETCRECGAMKVIACIEDPVVIKQILDHLKHKAETRESRV